MAIAFVQKTARFTGLGVASVTSASLTTTSGNTMAAAGSPTLPGSAAMAEGRDTMAAAGSTTVLGTLARTNQNDTMSASGTSGTVTANPPQLPVRGAGS